jgi:hypothetical protein
MPSRVPAQFSFISAKALRAGAPEGLNCHTQSEQTQAHEILRLKCNVRIWTVGRLLLTNIQPNVEQPLGHPNSLTNHIGKLA